MEVYYLVYHERVCNGDYSAGWRLPVLAVLYYQYIQSTFPRVHSGILLTVPVFVSLK